MLSKTAPAGPLVTGAALQYTLTATNNGPSTMRISWSANRPTAGPLTGN